MQRRSFLALPLLVSAVSCAKSKDKEEAWRVIESVQNHLLPRSKKYPSASDVQATRYLKMVSHHDSFDKDDLDFILSGVERLQDAGYKTIMIDKEKERVLETFSQTQYGENWLSLLINYTLEAMFSDPLYGGNKDEKGWNAYQHKAGNPRPTKTFGAKHG